MAATWVNAEAIGSYFESLSDPRHTRDRNHLLPDIVVIAVCGMVCGCDGPTAIHRWAANRRSRLEQFLALPNGIPSRDCIRRLLLAPKPEAFRKCVQDWIAQAVRSDDDGSERLIALDGKTCRRSHAAAQGLGPPHIVSAWASEEGIALGQVATEEKSNEITALPLLLEQIDLTDSLSTIDAMGCPREIAHGIVEGGGDLVISVKGNQPTLREMIEAHVEEHLERDVEDLRYRSHETSEAAHGRIDGRPYFLARVPRAFALEEEWPWIRAIGYSRRVTRHADGRETDETRFYILSRYLSGKRFSEAVRGDWGIESRHWVLDVDFREADSRTRERTLGTNLSWLRRVAVSLLQRHPSADRLRGKMLRCLMHTEFLTEVLTLQRH